MKRSLLVLALIVVVAPAMAQVKDLAEIDMRLGPPNFGPVGGVNCSAPFAAIPDGPGGTLTDTLTIADTKIITELQVLIQATHTWTGDLSFVLTHVDTGTSASIIDRPGYTTVGFGCSGDDYDVLLNDTAEGGSVEDVCEAAVPAIAGDLTPSPDPLSLFAGETKDGVWEMSVTDHAGGDTGSLNTWCVDNKPGNGDGGTGTPATSTWGVIALIALFMSVSVFYLRRRS